MDFRIREGGRADSAVCWALYTRAVLEGAGAHYTEAERRVWVPEAAEPPWMAERLGAGRTWIAEEDGGPVGFLVASGLGGPGCAHLDLFFTLPRVRGTGVAPALYAAFELAAREAGQAAPLTAHASLYLRPFLERRGWRVVRADPTSRGGDVLMRFAMERRGP